MSKVLSAAFLILLAISVFARVAVAAPASAASDEEHIGGAWIDEFIEHQLRSHGIPGATLAWVEGDTAPRVRGFGLADVGTSIDPRREVTDRTLFRIGSVSKLFVWFSLMQLAEGGLLSIDDSVDKHLCGHSITLGIGPTITVRHLMDHTSGFESRRRGTFAKSTDEFVSLRDLVEREAPPRIRDPGSVEAYSNFGTCVAARVVECVSAMAFEQYVQQRILDPIGMEDTSSEQPLPVGKLGNAAKGYFLRSGQPVEGQFELIRMGPAGAMSSSAMDMAAFIRVLLGESHGALGPQFINLMFTGSHVPSEHLGGMAHGFFVTIHNGIRALWHGGDTPMFHSLLMLVPERKLGMFVSYNAPPGAVAYRDLMAAVLDRLEPSQPQSPSVPQAAWIPPKSIAGFYRSSRVAHQSYEKLEAHSGDLVVALEGNGIRVLGRSWVPVMPWVFVDVGSPDRLVFELKAGVASDDPCDPSIDAPCKVVERFRVATRPMQTFERVRGDALLPIVNFNVVAEVVMAVVLAIGVAVSIGMMTAMVARFVASRPAASAAMVKRVADWQGLVLGGVSSLMGLLVVLLIGLMARQGSDAWQYGVPYLVWLVRVAAGLLVAFTLGCVVASGKSWFDKLPSMAVVMHRVVVVMASVLVMVWTVWWGIMW